MNQPKIDLTEMFAEHISDCDILESSSKCESFAEILAQIINENLPENVEMTDDEWDKLMICLEKFVENNLVDSAVEMVNEWIEDAREIEEAKRSAIYG